jgi:hypothetical protein
MRYRVSLAALALVPASLLTVTGGSSAAAASSCPVGHAAVTHVAYVVFAPDGSSKNVTRLSGNVADGDQVNALFNVPPLPQGCSNVRLVLVAYQLGGSQGPTVYSKQLGRFIAGGRYEMSATIPSAAPGGTTPFAIEFATGRVLPTPQYGANRIGGARG